jgi:5-formyltetrahydrofolate cyclo-ligase
LIALFIKICKRSWCIQLNKKNIRKHFQEIRRQISAKERINAAEMVVEHLTHSPLFKQSQHIACYMHVHHELATQGIIEAIWHAKKYCYLPILNEDKSLTFVLYQKGDALKLNQYAIPEPKKVTQWLGPETLDLILMPLVAFDKRGNRIGTGGGYYDRTLAHVDFSKQHKPYIVGLAYAAQQADELPHESWDISLDAVLTENGIKPFSR